MYSYGQQQRGYAYPQTGTNGLHVRGPAYPMIIGAEGDKTLTEKAKDFLNTETMGVKRSYLLGGAAALGLIYYGYTKHWFG